MTLPIALRAFWYAFIPAAILAWPILKGLIALKSRQTVSQYVAEHQVKQGTPTMGGLIIIAGTLVGFLALQITGAVAQLGDYWILMVGFATIGFVDDFVVPRMIKGKRGLGWKQKILMELVLAVIPFATVDRSNMAAAIWGVFLVLFFSNAYNFTDGLDGLAASVGICLLLGLSALSFYLVGSSPEVGIVAMCLIGATVPFFFLNAAPAKVFMGDVGSLPIGAVIGLIFWKLLFTENIVQGKSSVACALGVISLVMIVELVPVPLQIASVKLRKKKIFLFTPIHHAFEKIGWPETRTVWRYALVQLLLSVLALTIVVTSGPEAIAVVSRLGR
ncbi:MAG TPA: hypothetical protein VG944_07460 [Fimbriimonas sp.]|nr:hypothetical protein [Fimbriimonas sp.]